MIELSDRLITSISVINERAIDHFFGMINERAIDLFLVIKQQVWRFSTEKKILVCAFLLNYLFGT